MEFLIGGILIGLTMALTVYNTIKLHKKQEIKEEPMTEKEKRIERDVEAMMNYRGRS